MSERVMISPVTRLNGFWRVDVLIEDGIVKDAWSSGIFFRGFELILEGREPRDAIYLTERICGICSSAHGMASSRALENACGVEAPRNGVLMRNLIFAVDMLQNHIRHFYLLAVPDFVEGPDMPPFLPRYNVDFRLSKSATERIMANYLESLKLTREFMEIQANLGGKSPHTHGILAGGAPVAPDADKIRYSLSVVDRARKFITEKYIPDVYTLGEAYPDYYEIGKGHGNFLIYDLFPQTQPDGGPVHKGGVMIDGRLESLDIGAITEHVRFSWFSPEDGPRKPEAGSTHPDTRKVDAYSWVKAPRYRGKAVETGPLAVQWIARGYRRGISVMDRHVARALMTKETAELIREWLLSLEPGKPVFEPYEIPAEAEGVGAVEAFRGGLGHWVKIEGRRIARYQIVTPSAWNCSPRDDSGQRGAVEEALVGTPVKDPRAPIEVGRVIRSFDPCLACAAHVIRSDGSREDIRIS
ncbi:MAG TPA: nickel-dependent hydrogenase large subunit [Firmicutes bacterium]|nr:nickel-dependent hydrogenase large subunit [Bacillota bacterium]